MNKNAIFISKFKKIFLFLCAICFGSVVMANTINWYVDGELYTTTNCASGGDVILPATPTKPGQTFVGWATYTPIAYIQLNGVQWIDTGIVPNTNTKFRVKLNMQYATGQYIIGFNTQDGVYRFFNYNGQIFFDYINDTSGRITGRSNSFALNTTYDFFVGTQYVKDYTTNTILLGQEKVINYAFVNTINLGALDTVTYGKFYLLQIWEGDTMVRDFIPVLDYNDVPCMFDKVTNTFFYNQGSGDFIAGPVVAQ